MKTFDFNNPNADAMVVPQEEGGTEDDHYFGSIGDATMKHVYSLDSNQRQMWEELIHMPSGAVFRAVPSLDQNDPDPFLLRGKDLKKYIENLKKPHYAKDPRDGVTKKYRGLREEELQIFKEAIEEEQKRREESEDVLDKGDLVPYDEWEKFPQQWNVVEIPKSPKDRFVYMGNTTQMFYDSFPEGHPDSAVINQVLNLLNVEWSDDVTSVFAEWIKDNVINPSKARPYTKGYLSWLAERMAENEQDPNTLVETALSNIDRCWGIEIKNEVAKNMSEDQMLQIIVSNEKEWNEQAKKGVNVYASIKAFGHNLFQDTELRAQMRPYHWHRYYRMKKNHAPRVMCRGVDINRCSVQRLREALKVSRDEAEKVWFNRPYESLGILYHKGYISKGTFADDETTDKIASLLESRAKTASDERDLRKLTAARHLLMGWQRDNKYELKPSQWRMLWEYYRLLKSNVTQEVNKGTSYDEQQEEGI